MKTRTKFRMKITPNRYMRREPGGGRYQWFVGSAPEQMEAVTMISREAHT